MQYLFLVFFILAFWVFLLLLFGWLVFFVFFCFFLDERCQKDSYKA